MYPGNNLFHMIESMDDELYLIPNKYLEDHGKGFVSENSKYYQRILISVA